MGKFHPPMFCDNCSYLAMAVLDGAPLCLSCLTNEVKNSTNPNLVNEVQPLDLDLVDFREMRRNPQMPDTRYLGYDKNETSSTKRVH